jgi:general secretion pathway protein D
VPGLSDIPVIGRLFAFNRMQVQETDIILTLTPHIVRVLDLSESDLRPFRLGRDFSGGAPADLPRLPIPGGGEDTRLPGPEKPAATPAGPPTTPFPQPLQGPMPGTPLPITPLPKKPGGGGGG